MKGIMKVGFVLSALIAVVLMPGLASAQPTCVELGIDGDNVTMLWRLENGDIAEDYEAVELFIAEIGEVDITAGDPGTATFPWDDALEVSDFAQLVLQNDAGEDEESRIYFAVPYDVAEDRIDMGFDTPAEAIAAGGNCEAVETGPSLSLNVEGATFAEEGGDITLTANEDMMAPFQWKLDGGDLGGETDATLSLSPTETGDTGVYTLEFTDGEAKADFISNPVSVSIFPPNSLPVTSLLGIGLLALTSALAGGTVLARMKK